MVANSFTSVFSMKKYFLHILLFFFLVVLMDYGFGKLCSYAVRHAKGGETHPLQYVAYDCDKDIVILGSSRAIHHYDDKLIEDSLGISTYNAGMDGQGIISMYARYKLLAQHHLPKLIVYDVEPLFDYYEYNDAEGTRYTAHLKVLADNPDVYHIITDVIPSEKLKLKSNLYRYNIVWISNISDWLLRSSDSDFGFQPLYGEMKVPNTAGGQSNLKVDTVKQSYLNRLIAEAKKDGVKLVFIASPKYDADSKTLEPIKALCESNDIDFWDYTNIEKYNRLNMFKEPMHLNYSGAELFSTEIAGRLAGQYDSLK